MWEGGGRNLMPIARPIGLGEAGVLRVAVSPQVQGH